MLIHSGLLFVFYIHQTNLYVTKSGRKCPLKWLIDFLQFCVCWFSDQTLSNLLYTSLNLEKLFRLNLKIWGHCWADSGQCLLKMIKSTWLSPHGQLPSQNAIKTCEITPILCGNSNETWLGVSELWNTIWNVSWNFKGSWYAFQSIVKF